MCLQTLMGSWHKNSHYISIITKGLYLNPQQMLSKHLKVPQPPDIKQLHGTTFSINYFMVEEFFDI